MFIASLILYVTVMASLAPNHGQVAGGFSANPKLNFPVIPDIPDMNPFAINFGNFNPFDTERSDALNDLQQKGYSLDAVKNIAMKENVLGLKLTEPKSGAQVDKTSSDSPPAAGTDKTAKDVEFEEFVD